MITEKTSVEEIIEKNPSVARIFLQYGLPCVTCGEPFWGTLEELAAQHHFDKMNELLEELNRET
ncbi:DUF1858 domain-containing protein [bacterium]|nr:DUF1858 domain-containing protein [bacterium]MBU1937432.1 DUF1858 domain-containing protein [bacterium]